MSQSRAAKGTPSGGQFGASVRAEAPIGLAPEPNEDDLDFARETLGPEASDDEVLNLANLRLDREAADDVERPTHVEPTLDQSYCDLNMHQQCSGYTEDEADPETCMCSCHDDGLRGFE